MRARFIWADLFHKGESSRKPITDVLARNVLFETLTGRELAYLSTHVHERTYDPKEMIFEQDERGMGMYVIVSGKVAIRARENGGETLVATLGEGSFFGELALIEPESVRSASAVAQERATLIGFFKPDLFEILERKPAMGVKILLQLSMVLGRRLVETTRLASHESAPKQDPKQETDGSQRRAQQQAS